MATSRFLKQHYSVLCQHQCAYQIGTPFSKSCLQALYVTCLICKYRVVLYVYDALYISTVRILYLLCTCMMFKLLPVKQTYYVCICIIHTVRTYIRTYAVLRTCMYVGSYVCVYLVHVYCCVAVSTNKLFVCSYSWPTTATPTCTVLSLESLKRRGRTTMSTRGPSPCGRL